MKFTVKDYTNKWQALEIGTKMGCVISSLLFVLAMKLILRGTSFTTKGVMAKEQLVLPPSRVLWMISPFPSLPKLLLMVCYKNTIGENEDKAQEKSKPVINRGGVCSVIEIHLKIGGDIIPIGKKASGGFIQTHWLIDIGVQRFRK